MLSQYFTVRFSSRAEMSFINNKQVNMAIEYLLVLIFYFIALQILQSQKQGNFLIPVGKRISNDILITFQRFTINK